MSGYIEQQIDKAIAKASANTGCQTVFGIMGLLFIGVIAIGIFLGWLSSALTTLFSMMIFSAILL